jgi:hypothetical protein
MTHKLAHTSIGLLWRNRHRPLGLLGWTGTSPCCPLAGPSARPHRHRPQRSSGSRLQARLLAPGHPRLNRGLIHQQSKEEIRSQEPTEAGQQALLKKIKEKYKIKVVDPDFFNGQKTP